MTNSEILAAVDAAKNSIADLGAFAAAHGLLEKQTVAAVLVAMFVAKYEPQGDVDIVNAMVCAFAERCQVPFNHSELTTIMRGLSTNLLVICACMDD